MPELISFNENWLFEGTQQVRLPHTAVEVPYHYFDEKCYQRAFTYEKTFTPPNGWQGTELSLLLEAAMADAKIYLNGDLIAEHKDGYTPIHARLTDGLTDGENHLRIVIDGSENPEIPPFGGRIDYLCFAGIYRDVWLVQNAPLAIETVKIETPDVLNATKTLTAQVYFSNPQKKVISGTLEATLKDSEGNPIAHTQAELTGERLLLQMDNLQNIELWDVDAPHLYTLDLALKSPHGDDHHTTRFGFRHAEFTTDGFFLNGRSLKIRGLNRHQSFPYSGYAIGRSGQERDADLLKYDLRLNLVRTSHYPQSTAFLNRCDEIGLLVFEEIPGWQHIGGEKWKAESVENVRRMITRDWNHPSIIIWGVRINESEDDHAFYTETNRVARALDPTRQTGGVRCIEDSELLEDVYTMNDFNLGSHEISGSNRAARPLRDQREVTGLDHDVPYLITEYNGHMFPTKAHDQELRQIEHVTRHLQVLNAAFGAKGTAGAIGWCAFDYNTHSDFGAGDRICYHGVADMYRELKFAGHVYASQGEPEGGLVLEPVTLYARGERNINGILPLTVLTNCDSVELRYGTATPIRGEPDRINYPHLPHPPVVFRLEDFPEDALGNWGTAWDDCEVVGIWNGEAAISRKYCAAPLLTSLSVVPDATEIADGQDVRVMVRALDQVGNKARHAADPVTIEVKGAARLHGPALVPLRAGSTGFWLRAEGTGPITISVSLGSLGTTETFLTAI
ncbi:glycoside hydrolase family 2 protein (plasmid) [Falsihalocynthiibacter sp. SS001]|uniref:glycoside hydrolase family 2 protein n=1 Tax=Falsihalocynthiibacter sp. SS001 TaxID=3349698 RepID=UPI0036D3DDAF